MKSMMMVGLLLVASAAVKADSIAVVTQDLRQGSALTLRNDVAQDLAENLLAAQAAAPYTQFEPDSLPLSIAAVLKAISLEKSFGLAYCDDSNCPIVWAQSTVAIDDRVSVTVNPSALYFSDPAPTPEPCTLLMMVAAAIIGLFLIGWPRKRYGR